MVELPALEPRGRGLCRLPDDRALVEGPSDFLLSSPIAAAATSCPPKQLAELRDQQSVRVAGLVLLRQRPATAKGITFVTLEDETGTANLVIHQNTWQRFYTIARRSPAWIAHGRLEIRQT